MQEGAGDGKEMWKKDEGESEKTARGAGLYTFEKAAGGAMPDALPKETAPNPKGPRLAWKQERARISPGRRLFLGFSRISLLLIALYTNILLSLLSSHCYISP